MVKKMVSDPSRTRIRLLLARFRGFWIRFKKNRPAVGGLIVILFFTLVAVSASIISPYHPFEMNFGKIFTPPNSEFILGTDQYGRDILSRIIWGTRVSLFVGFFSTGISAFLGITLGSIAGYAGGRTDEIIMRFVDVFMMIPTFFLILTIVSLFGSSIWNVMII